jgi:FtsZ-binding cell division protein ZapB
MAAWTPPTGIPTPDFGLDEAAPPVPDPWTAETPGFYYVGGSGASDSRTYGHPGAPRITIPLSLPAGAVVEIHGNYTQSHASPKIIAANGTKEQPVFIRGLEDTVVTRGWLIKGTYFIVENLKWALAASSESKPPCLKFISPTDHAALRNSDLGGNLTGGGIQVVSSKHVVVWKNDIHDSGDVNYETDQDIHSINISGANNVWVVDNEIHESSGSGVQVNAGSAAAQPNTHHIYLGRNHVYLTRQSGLFSKQAVDVIISQNKIHDIINTSWSPSKGLGFQYAPERVWYLYNDVSGCTFGIYSGSDSGMGTGRDTYFIGNVIHDIHTLSGYNPNSAWAQAGIMLAGGINRYVTGNTIHDVDGGVYCPSSGGKIDIKNNIISKITQPGGTHIFVEMGAVANASAMCNNLFGEEAKIKWGSNTVKTLAQFQAAFPGKGAECVDNEDPVFANAADGDFTLGETSPAINAGTPVDVYETFKTLYGIDISVDKNGDKRPFGAGWDIGAYEYQSGGGPGPEPPDPCADVKAELETVKAENAALTTENARLVTENATLKTENEALKTENAELQQRIASAIQVLEGTPAA